MWFFKCPLIGSRDLDLSRQAGRGCDEEIGHGIFKNLRGIGVGYPQPEEGLDDIVIE